MVLLLVLLLVVLLVVLVLVLARVILGRRREAPKTRGSFFSNPMPFQRRILGSRLLTLRSRRRRRLEGGLPEDDPNGEQAGTTYCLLPARSRN
jgi:hypothetical protein